MATIPTEVKPRRVLKSKKAEKPVEPLAAIIKPFLKWVGGKTQIIDDVLRQFPSVIENYHEPFLGGGSVLLGLLSQQKAGRIQIKGKLYASDLNSNLVSLYTNIQQSVDQFIVELKSLTEPFETLTGKEVNREAKTKEEATSQESYYYWIRSRFNAMTKAERGSLLGSAMFLFMNKTCFRGVYREGPNGFNVPFGHYKNPGILDEPHIRLVAGLVKDIIFTCQPFLSSLERVQPGDFVYLDPPYAPETEKSFVGYTADGFSLKEHQSLFKEMANLNQKAKFVMSNADVKLVKDAFPEPTYKTKIVSCRRAINSKDPAAKTNEVLIRN